MTWLDILGHWRLLEGDLHRLYGIDVESGILDDRTMRWFDVRVYDTLGHPDSALRAALRARPTTPA